MEPVQGNGNPDSMIPEQNTDTTLNLQSMAPAQETLSASPFRTHQLQPRDHIPAVHRKEHPDWMFAVLLTGFILIAWTLVFYYKRFTTVISASFSKRHLSQLTREGNLLRERITISLSAVYILATSLLIYQLNMFYFKWNDPVMNGFRLYVLITLLVVLFWTMKLFAMNLLSVVFKTYQSNHEYLLNIMLFSTLSSLILLPLLVLSVYLNSRIILDISLIIISLIFITRFIKGMMIGVQLTRFSYLFLFVYLCALELLPLVVILKFALLYNALFV
jgi:hypothetical protein